MKTFSAYHQNMLASSLKQKASRPGSPRGLSVFSVLISQIPTWLPKAIFSERTGCLVLYPHSNTNKAAGTSAQPQIGCNRQKLPVPSNAEIPWSWLWNGSRFFSQVLTQLYREKLLSRPPQGPWLCPLQGQPFPLPSLAVMESVLMPRFSLRPIKPLQLFPAPKPVPAASDSCKFSLLGSLTIRLSWNFTC